jgi:ketosteroid isomerase-like protein
MTRDSRAGHPGRTNYTIPPEPRRIDAVNAGDVVRLLTLMADDVVFLNPGQTPFGRDGLGVHYLGALNEWRWGMSPCRSVRSTGKVAWIAMSLALGVSGLDAVKNALISAGKILAKP